jgi:AcrR family transcriptional regulator
MKRTKNETRARILEAAVELLEKKSSQFIQLRDIADRAGVSASLLVQYFGSKEELVFEARLVRLASETEQGFTSLAQAGQKVSLEEVLRRCFEHDLNFPAATKDLMSVRWWWTKEDEERFRKALTPRFEAIRRSLMRELGGESEQALSAAYSHVLMVYQEILRDGCVSGKTADQAMAQLKSLLAPILSAYRQEIARGDARVSA